MSVCFLALLFSMSSFLLSALEAFLLIPFAYCLLALEFLQDPCLETLHPPLFLCVLYLFSFMVSLTGSVVNAVTSSTTSGHSFLHWEFFVSGLMAFMAF